MVAPLPAGGGERGFGLRGGGRVQDGGGRGLAVVVDVVDGGKIVIYTSIMSVMFIVVIIMLGVLGVGEGIEMLEGGWYR